jgi:hypothetical protein
MRDFLIFQEQNLSMANGLQLKTELFEKLGAGNPFDDEPGGY